MENLLLTVILFGVSVVTSQDACSSPVTITGGSGVISSKNPYSNGEKCRWIFNTRPGQSLQLDFGRFALEGSGNRCSYDYVVIYDSDAVDKVLSVSPCSQSSLNQVKFGPFCGTEAPQTLVSSGSRMVVDFCTDSSETKAGFELYYKETKTVVITPGSACNETVTIDGKHTVSYYSGNGYPSYQECFYSYRSKSGKPLKITTQAFALEGVFGCRYDRVSVFDGNSASAPSLGIFCGTNGPANVRTTGSDLYLTFSSDQYTNDKGFSFTVQESCAGTHLCSKDDAGDDECYEPNQTCNGHRECANGRDESFCADGCGLYPDWRAGQPFPGAAALTRVDGQIHCGGALINDQYVLTAAHCFHRLDTKPERFVVKVGAARLVDAFVGQIQKITVHPLFNPKSLANNLALVRLKTPVPLQSSIAPFCVPFTADTAILPEDGQCYTLGWGRTNPNSITSYASSVKQLPVKILENVKCKWSNSPVIVDGTNICASTSGPLCYGDNGAPLVCKHSNNKWQVYGINSVAFGCTGGSTIPSSFTKISAYDDWIRTTAFADLK